MKPTELWTRRLILKRAAQLGAMGVATPLAINLAAMGEAAAFTDSGYKALVCVFLYGGNDYANTVVPYDNTNYNLYSAIRGGGAGQTAGGIAIARADLAATALTPNNGQILTDNQQYALAPQLSGLKGLFDAGRLAVQLNVGPLLVPLTLAQYQNPNRSLYPLPPKLFSHNDQQSTWQSLASEGSVRGWGGRMGDLALSTSSNTPNSLLTCISATGNAVFVAGENALQYQVSPSGATRISGINDAPFGSVEIRDALSQIITRNSTHVLEAEYASVTRRSIALEGVVNGALTALTPLTTAFSQSNPLARQMQIVARLIAARNALSMRRQVFFVSIGGFDNHNGLIQDHPGLMTRVNDAMTSFYNATVCLGVQSQVTTFTASDFGRTLSSNADGSDHGWGGHHFVMGGAVNGGRFYGTAPSVSVQSNDQVGQGRLLPSTSVDQFAAQLASWFGVADGELPSVLPNLSEFTVPTTRFV